MPRIAVIDDEPLVCAMVEYLLCDDGADVHCATNVRRGAELLTDGGFDLALIDVLLPEASGFALAELAANENIPVLLMSGHPDAAMRMDALDIPCLLKPFDLVGLSMATAREIARSHENIERVKQGMARLVGSAQELSNAIAFSKTLIERSREIVAKASGGGLM